MPSNIVVWPHSKKRPCPFTHRRHDTVLRHRVLARAEMKLNTARKKWADETLQSSIRSTDRETIEGDHRRRSLFIYLFIYLLYWSKWW
jgi:hypothetical protein